MNDNRMNDLLEQINTAAGAYDADKVAVLSDQLLKHIRDNIALHPPEFVKELENSVRVFDHKLAQKLCAQLIKYLRISASPYSLTESKKILSVLRRKRYFDLITQVADVLIQMGQDEANIRRQYAQALIDQGGISAGLDVLHNLKRHCDGEKDAAELIEVRGLIGRAYKQIYINAYTEGQDPSTIARWLEKAISAYAEVYEENKQHIWHGINAVALLERAKYDSLDFRDFFPDTLSTAKEILDHIASKEEINLWDQATAGEACLALKDYSQALQWIQKYTQKNPDADAFEYSSTLRQFEEVWRLDEENSEHARIIHLLREAVLRQEGGRVESTNLAKDLALVSTLEADQEFEKVLGKDRYKTFQWYRTGLDRAASVAQILDRFGNGHGSGFLVRGKDIHHTFGEEWVVVTNTHVISDDLLEQSALPPSLPPDEVKIKFEAIDPNQEFLVKEILFSSPRSALDCTILRLQSPIEHTNPYPIAKRLPLVGKNQRVYIIGHPRGGGLSYSIDDNLLLDHERPKVHYRTPTEGGSSGSPVFNQDWDLIALHHAGGLNMNKLNKKPGSYPANEGLCFQSIRDAVASTLV